MADEGDGQPRHAPKPAPGKVAHTDLLPPSRSATPRNAAMNWVALPDTTNGSSTDGGEHEAKGGTAATWNGAVTIDAPASESYVENRATIDDTGSAEREAKGGDVASWNGAVTIDAPASESCVENRATIDDSGAGPWEMTDDLRVAMFGPDSDSEPAGASSRVRTSDTDAAQRPPSKQRRHARGGHGSRSDGEQPKSQDGQQQERTVDLRRHVADARDAVADAHDGAILADVRQALREHDVDRLRAMTALLDSTVARAESALRAAASEMATLRGAAVLAPVLRVSVEDLSGEIRVLQGQTIALRAELTAARLALSPTAIPAAAETNVCEPEPEAGTGAAEHAASEPADDGATDPALMSERPLLAATPRRVDLPSTMVGEMSATVPITLTNRGEHPVEVEDVEIAGSQASDFVAVGRSEGPIEPGASTEVGVAFQPTQARRRHATLRIRANQGAKAAHVRLRGVGEPFREKTEAEIAAEHGEALYDAASNDDGSVAPSVATYGDMLAALLAAQRLTDQGDPTSYQRAAALLEPVAARLGALSPIIQDKLRDFGLAQTGGLARFGYAHGAVDEWLRKLRLGSTINTTFELTCFQIGEEEIKLATGEIKDAPQLRALHRAGTKTAIVAAALPVAAAAAPMLAELAPVLATEAGLLAHSARWLGSRVTVWALSNPEAALALSEVLIGLGIQIGEGGWDQFGEQLQSDQGVAFLLMQIAMDAMHMHQATHADANPGGGWRPRAPVDEEPDVTPRAPRATVPDEPAGEPAGDVAPAGRTVAGKTDGTEQLSPEAASVKEQTLARARQILDTIEQSVGGRRSSTNKVGRDFETVRDKVNPDTEELPQEVVDVITASLPGIDIAPENPARGIEAYLRAQGSGDVEVTPLGGGKSGASVYLVKQGDQVVGVFKIFNNATEMAREVAALQRLRDLQLATMEPVGIGDAATVAKAGGPTGAAMLEPARGDFVRNTMDAAGKANGPERTEALTKLARDCDTVARGLAEMHVKSASGERVASGYKEDEIKHLGARWSSIVDRDVLRKSDAGHIGAKLQALYADFRAAPVEGSYAHGDAHAGNFSVHASGTVSVIDTETLFRSVGPDGKGAAPGATDVGRFAESLRVFGVDAGLTPAEIGTLQADFVRSYSAHFTRLSGSSPGAGHEVATRFYQANLDTIALNGASRELAAVPSDASSAARDAAHAKVSAALEALKATLGIPSRFDAADHSRLTSEPNGD